MNLKKSFGAAINLVWERYPSSARGIVFARMNNLPRWSLVAALALVASSCIGGEDVSQENVTPDSEGSASSTPTTAVETVRDEPGDVEQGESPALGSAGEGEEVAPTGADILSQGVGSSEDQGADAMSQRALIFIDAGWFYSCGMRPDHTVTCWGYGQNAAPIPPEGGFLGLSAGGEHACGVRQDSTLECWGDDGYGQSTAPGGLFKSVSAGGFHTCGVRQDSTLECWGDDGYGQSTGPWGLVQVGFGRGLPYLRCPPRQHP